MKHHRSLLIALLFLFLIPHTRASQHGPLSGPLVVSDQWPECTSLETWMHDIMRLGGVEDASDTAQAKVFFRWLRLFSKMATGGMIQAFEGNYGQEKHVADAHKNLFVYGWGFCDTHSRIAEAAWQEYKQDSDSAVRVITQHENGGYHTMHRLKLDGQWAAFDARYGYYLIEEDSPNARILDWAEVGIDENILRNKNFKHRSQPFFEFFGKEWERALLVNPTYYKTEEDWVNAGRPVECVFGNPMYTMGTPFHDMSFQLPRGTTIERYWDNSTRKFYVPKRVVEEPFLPSGRFYRVTETMLDGNWVKYDPNYQKAAPYVTTVPEDEGYNSRVAGGKTIGQAWGKLIYSPDLSDPGMIEGSAIDGDLVHSPESPYLRPADLESGGEVTVDFYNPYILVDGTLSGRLAANEQDRARVEIRTLAPKPNTTSSPENWSRWQVLHEGGGPFEVELGRTRYNGNDVSIHGKYRFQLRVSFDRNPDRATAVGLQALKLESYFETGIMSIPQIFAGDNQVHFKVHDSSRIQAPIEVVYEYQTESGVAEHRQLLDSEDFTGNVATYQISAPGLTRCDALKIHYR